MGNDGLEFRESQWQKVFYCIDDVSLFLAIHYDFHLAIVALLHFHDYLSARTAWRDWQL